ncbi:MAG: hypothetical protein H6631_07150 [Anaerolineaceae bacterium]|nr:hypothetical protein [Anaerolineaceae bacterium]MCB9097915.1 hypothetical protein [Anaerolineales bacterium]
MNDKLDKALNHLNTILPLKKRQDECPPEVREIFTLPEARQFASRFFAPFCSER